LIKEFFLKTVVLHNIFADTKIHFIFQDSQINRNIYLKYKYFVTNAFGTFGQFNAALLRKKYLRQVNLKENNL